jgi:hypothetical protein
LALQLFMLRHHLLKRGLLLGVLMLGGLAVTTLMNGQPLADSLVDLGSNIGRYAAIFVAGLVIIHLVAMLMAFLAWRRLAKPREIRAEISAGGIALQKDGFSYNARWRDADLVDESRNAFLMKFNQLYMRLPKRGFPGETQGQFRDLARAAAPAAADKLRR